MKTNYLNFVLVCLTLFFVLACSEDKTVEKLELNKSSIELIRGTTELLEVDIVPDYPVYWVSSDNDVAVVDENGLVKAVSVGKAVVSAVAMDKKADCIVNVVGIPVSSVTLDKEACDMVIGKTVILNAVVLPEDADNNMVVWNSSDPEVASVDESGCVTALAAGSALITAVAGGIEAQCSVNVLAPVMKGDYFYSDGSYSTELNLEKTAVGVVFWVGNPTEDDPSLKSDYPNCTHGLVVSLSEQRSVWQEYSDNVNAWVEKNATEYKPILVDEKDNSIINKISGYNNTKAIEKYNADENNASKPVEVIQKVVALNEDSSVPGTSGWYLPSSKELSLLCSGEYDGNIFDIYSKNEVLVENRDFINERLAKIEGAMLLGASNPYWASQEHSASQSYYVYFQKGFVRMLPKNSNVCFVRAVLAF